MEQRKFKYLILSLLLTLLIPEFQAECYWRTTGACKYGKYKYKVGEMWKTIDCYQCSCIAPTQIICCDMVNYTVDVRQYCAMWYDARTRHPSQPCGRRLKQQLKRYKKSIYMTSVYRNLLSLPSSLRK
ncbi:prostate-associated microseminoprotein [Hypanus sabinus]|uniref:prostate-associated microseminoprotein n=1 Tax=Hypanus sabinus TaxID=79690 RepID=UPI0028C418D5|nr:prostate-associated microseminoprotein [Hypanus sabinus]